MEVNYSEISRVDNSLRPYQQNAKESIFTSWNEVDDILFQMPTGTGKTRLFTSIISDIKAWSVLKTINYKILIIAHRIELIDQISESLDRYKISHGIIAGGRERDLRKYVQVASIQTITHHTNIDTISDLNIGFIIIDEAHHSVARSYKKLWKLFPDAKKLGVTATPWRMNNIGFTEIYQKLITSKPIKDFISEGWLAPYNYYSVRGNSIEQEKISSITEFDVEGDYKTSALEREMDTVQIRARLLDSYKKIANGKKGIIYSISRKHSDHICEEYKKAGINIVKIDSLTPRDERKMYVQRFKNGQIDIIVNVDIFSEGFDCPDIEFIQLARPTKSLVKYLQQVGRGLRPTMGKSNCIILDNVGSSNEFGLPDSNRDWNLYFIGDSSKKQKASTKTSNSSSTVKERSIEEGNDYLYLVESIDSENASINALSSDWSNADDELLKLLYQDRKCGPEIISLVLKRGIDEINQRLVELAILPK